MAIDYLKVKIINADIKKILASEILDFKGLYSASTGAIEDDKVVAELHFCKVVIYKSGSVYFSGSIHKMYNSIKGIKAPSYKEDDKKRCKGFNGNQFGVEEIYFVINYLEKLLSTCASNMKITTLELGLNLELNFDPQLFILGLLYFRGTPFELKFKRTFGEVEFGDFKIKIYNKSRQYGMHNFTLRVEVKFKRMKVLNEAGMETLHLSPKNLHDALNLVLKKFDDVVYYDNTIRENKLTKPQKRNLDKYKNVRYWLDDLKPNKRSEPKSKLNKIILNNSDNLKESIKRQFVKTGVINTRYPKDKQG